MLAGILEVWISFSLVINLCKRSWSRFSLSENDFESYFPMSHFVARPRLPPNQSTAGQAHRPGHVHLSQSQAAVGCSIYVTRLKGARAACWLFSSLHLLSNFCSNKLFKVFLHFISTAENVSDTEEIYSHLWKEGFLLFWGGFSHSGSSTISEFPISIHGGLRGSRNGLRTHSQG